MQHQNVRVICLPEDDIFDTILENGAMFLNQLQGNGVYVAGLDGIMRPASGDELTEYIQGGEYDTRLTQIDRVSHGLDCI